ncbi:Isocitrate/isopropylmalate dehydrogenase [Aerococcus urinaehominis]|nr:isocitrate/isopropylmalate family dehydrogenase [Aerococcus urinaehominis]SDL97438.1 Isocitrate/isopropylmalate dehydrogenase [Aerococcus urinaehominis]
MMKVTLIPGDGIGPEIAQATIRILQAAGANVDWQVVKAGQAVYEETGELIPQAVYDSLADTRVGLKGPMTTPIGTGFRSANVALRKNMIFTPILGPSNQLVRLVDR